MAIERSQHPNTAEILAIDLPQILRWSMHKLSWQDTFKAMEKSREDWSEWSITAADGL